MTFLLVTFLILDYIEPVTFLGGSNLDKGTEVVVLGWGQTSDREYKFGK